MTCYHPVKAFKLLTQKTTNQKQVIVFKKPKNFTYQEFMINCGRCIGCRIERSRQWATRCVHEASLHKENCFITLTYNEENIPKNESLVKKHMSRFMKDIRQEYPKIRIRFFGCGEYGSKLDRPHYHICLFGFDFEDKYFFSRKDGVNLYRSATLEKLWKRGFSTIGQVTFESAAYVARYCQKVLNGEKAKHHYIRVDKETGEIFNIQKEFINMSRRPGIGKKWVEKYYSDVYPKNFMTIDGKKIMPPKYYDNIYDKINPDMMKKIKKIRVDKAKDNPQNKTFERLRIREKVAGMRIKTLIRSIEQ